MRPEGQSGSREGVSTCPYFLFEVWPAFGNNVAIAMSSYLENRPCGSFLQDRVGFSTQHIHFTPTRFMEAICGLSPTEELLRLNLKEQFQATTWAEATF